MSPPNPFKDKKAKEPVRPFRTDYSGQTRGYCKTMESAMIAAFTHLVYGEHTRATVNFRDSDKPAAWLTRTSAGIHLQVAKPALKRVA